MRIVALKTFIFLAKTNCDFNGFHILGIPRSTMWAHVNELEKETGLKLVFRKKQATALTDEGRAFVPYAQRLFEIYQEGLDAAHKRIDNSFRGELLIATTSALSQSWLVSTLADFHKMHRDIKLNIIGDDKITKQVELSADIILRPINEHLEGFDKCWYTSYHLGLYASQEYLDRMGTPKTAQDLLSHNILAYGEQEFTYYADVNWHIKGRTGLPRLKAIMTINSTTALFNAALNGLGIISLPKESPLYYKRDLIHVLPEFKGPVMKTYLCLKKTNNVCTQNNMDVFKKFLEARFQENGIDILHV